MTLLWSVFVLQVSEAECKAALDGERANVALARHCVEELGGVPSMLAPFDSTNRPEEKASVLCRLWVLMLSLLVEWQLILLLIVIDNCCWC